MKTYCINLDSRPRKWRRVQKEAHKINANLIRFPGIPGGHIGCTRSHLRILADNCYDEIFMIIEDDMKIIVKNPMQVIDKALRQLPANWDLLYLGATLSEPIKRYSDNLFVLKRALAAHAIIYNNQNGVVDYIVKNHPGPIMDLFYREDVQERFNCFITYPMVATQRAGMSDTISKYNSYKAIKRLYDKYTK